MTNSGVNSAAYLAAELAWLANVIDARLRSYFDQDPAAVDLDGPDALHTAEVPRLLSNIWGAGHDDTLWRLALILALAPHLRPQILDVFLTHNQATGRPFSEFGGVVKGNQFWPTLETAVFLAAGVDLEDRMIAMTRLGPAGDLAMTGYLALEASDPGDALGSLRLNCTPELLAQVMTGQPYQPRYGAAFPAALIETDLEWSDLVLAPATRQRVEEIGTWVQHGDTLLDQWGMRGKIRPGYRSLFFGPPGTGKTLTACLLGKATGRSVYRIDLSLVVSKYVGETEKNLGAIFAQAQARDWILFFDEADALFGKRSETQSAHDRYANQETAYLLQRIETFDGVAILASNFKDNIDMAFARRFESMIRFPIPLPADRLRLWQQGMPMAAQLDPDLSLEEVARDYTMTGGAIMNVIRYVCLRALERDCNTVSKDDVMQGIRREIAKDGAAV